MIQRVGELLAVAFFLKGGGQIAVVALVDVFGVPARALGQHVHHDIQQARADGAGALALGQQHGQIEHGAEVEHAQRGRFVTLIHEGDIN